MNMVKYHNKFCLTQSVIVIPSSIVPYQRIPLDIKSYISVKITKDFNMKAMMTKAQPGSEINAIHLGIENV